MAIVYDVRSSENASWISDTDQSRQGRKSHFDCQIDEQIVLQDLGSPVLGNCTLRSLQKKKSVSLGHLSTRSAQCTSVPTARRKSPLTSKPLQHWKEASHRGYHVVGHISPMDLASKLEHDFRVIPDLHNPQPALQCDPQALLSGGMVRQSILDLCHNVRQQLFHVPAPC